MWYHVILSTHRRRQVFKIAATASICERALREACAAAGWRADVIAVRSDAIQALIEVPRGTSRPVLVRRLKSAASAVISTRPVCDAGRRVFATGYWCAAVTKGAKVAAVRRYLRTGGVGLNTPTTIELL